MGEQRPGRLDLAQDCPLLVARRRAAVDVVGEPPLRRPPELMGEGRREGRQDIGRQDVARQAALPG